MNSLTVFPTFILCLLFLGGLFGAYSLNTNQSNIPPTVNINGMTLNQCFQYQVYNDSSAVGATLYLPNGSELNLLGNFQIGWLVEGMDNSHYSNSTSNFNHQYVFFNFDLQEGFMLVVGAIMLISGVTGITVFGTGLGNFAQSVIIKGSIYLGIWVFLSSFSLAILNTIPNNIGLYGVYLPLSLLFFLGFLQSMQHNDVE